MRTMGLALVLAFSLVVSPAFGQGTQMYDESYAGPRNQWGQPVYEPVPGPPGAYGPSPQAAPAALPVFSNAAQQAGSYLYGFLPAPLRGGDPSYTVAPGQGQVSVIYVPGTK
jgi:hypothetical protein